MSNDKTTLREIKRYVEMENDTQSSFPRLPDYGNVDDRDMLIPKRYVDILIQEADLKRVYKIEAEHAYPIAQNATSKSNSDYVSISKTKLEKLKEEAELAKQFRLIDNHVVGVKTHESKEDDLIQAINTAIQQIHANVNPNIIVGFLNESIKPKQ